MLHQVSRVIRHRSQSEHTDSDENLRQRVDCYTRHSFIDFELRRQRCTNWELFGISILYFQHDLSGFLYLIYYYYHCTISI